MDGVTAIRAARAQGAAVRVLVLTTFDTDRDVLPAIEAGATGYLLKDASAGELAARSAPPRRAAGARPERRRPSHRAGAARPDGAQPREVEVLRLVAAGTTNRETARGCSSARPPSRPTCCTSTRSSASTTGRPP